MPHLAQNYVKKLKLDEVLICHVEFLFAAFRLQLCLILQKDSFHLQQQALNLSIISFGHLLAKNKVWDVVEIEVNLLEGSLSPDPPSEFLKQLHECPKCIVLFGNDFLDVVEFKG